jgi:hypothetical protein
MQPFLFFRWRCRGRPWGRREARRQHRARSTPVREEEEGGRLGHEGGLGRPGGRGPVGEGRKKNGRLEEKKNGPWLGRKARWAEGDGENSFLYKI